MEIASQSKELRRIFAFKNLSEDMVCCEVGKRGEQAATGGAQNERQRVVLLCRLRSSGIRRWSLVRGTRELEGFVDKSVDLFEFPRLHQGADSFHHSLNRTHILTVFLHLLCGSHDAMDLGD